MTAHTLLAWHGGTDVGRKLLSNTSSGLDEGTGGGRQIYVAFIQ